jgi:hypothetical protein
MTIMVIEMKISMKRYKIFRKISPNNYSVGCKKKIIDETPQIIIILIRKLF